MLEIEEIKTERLLIKKMSIHDIDDYVDWHLQECYYNFLPGSVKTRDGIIESLKEYIGKYDKTNEKNLFWGIYYNNKLIGIISCEAWSSNYKYCRIGWGINPKFQKQGFAYESTKSFIDYVFKNYDIHRIEVVIWEGNTPSFNLAVKLGFKFEGISREARIKNGKYFDLYQYSILKDEWLNMRGISMQ